MRKNQEVIDTQEKAVQDARRVLRYLITTYKVHSPNCCATLITNGGVVRMDPLKR